MKRTYTLLVLSAIVVASSFAQDGQRPPPGERTGGFHHRPPPPPPPVMLALDVNGDRIIDAHEITNASAALRQLDKNGDGQLTDEELRSPRPMPPEGGRPGEGRPENREGEGPFQQGPGR